MRGVNQINQLSLNITLHILKPPPIPLIKPLPPILNLPLRILILPLCILLAYKNKTHPTSLPPILNLPLRILILPLCILLAYKIKTYPTSLSIQLPVIHCKRFQLNSTDIIQMLHIQICCQ